jgi:phospholipase C
MSRCGNVRLLLIITLFLTGAVHVSHPVHAQAPSPNPNPLTKIKTVFIILLENQTWATILGNKSAPYINKTLVPIASYASEYYNPPKMHPSEPNYIWLEAGDNLGIKNNGEPAQNRQSTELHLTRLLKDAGISWKTYVESIDGKECPIYSYGGYVTKHNPMVFFDDITDNLNPKSQYCIDHIRPYPELAVDLKENRVARYNFIVPHECNQMHNEFGCATRDQIRNGDTWLSKNVPQIVESEAFKDNGALFITFDEGAYYSDGPIPMIILSPLAKGGGYTNYTYYNHSSTLRTMQEIFGVRPFLRGAATAESLHDFFKSE